MIPQIEQRRDFLMLDALPKPLRCRRNHRFSSSSDAVLKGCCASLAHPSWLVGWFGRRKLDPHGFAAWVGPLLWEGSVPDSMVAALDRASAVLDPIAAYVWADGPSMNYC